MAPKIIYIFLSFIIFTVQFLFAQSTVPLKIHGNEQIVGGSGVPENYFHPLRKPGAFEDRGTGYLLVGNLIVGALESYGSIGGWREVPLYTYKPLGAMLVEWATLNCAFPRGGPKDLDGNPAIDSLSVTGKGKVYDYTFLSDVPTWNYQFTDWEAKDGARGHYLSGEVFNSFGKAMLATSTNPKTWPEGYFDENGDWISTPGERQWPGHWAVDPVTGKEVPGQFTADEEVFWHINDKNNGIKPRGPEESGAPIGLEYEIQAYAYSRAYARDFIFFNFKLTFTGDPDYDGFVELGAVDSLYMGVFWDSDHPFGFYDEQGYWHYDGDGEWDDYAYFIPEKNILISKDPDDFHVGNAYEGTVPRIALALVKKPVDRFGKEWDITNWHWFNYLDTWSNYEICDRRQYALISGDQSVLVGANERQDFNHDTDDDGFDEPELIPDGIDLMSQIGIGPLHMEPGDTLEWALAVIVGFTDEEIFEKLTLAQGMASNYFLGAEAPPSPELNAVGTALTETGEPLGTYDDPVIYSNDTKVTLYWSDRPENTPDPLTQELDFEGYKIYRSVNLGETWGIPGNDNAYITDEQGLEIGWIPIAQFDKINDFKGESELDPDFYLGDDTGLTHSWCDTTVIPGLRYRYTITAYDHGSETITPLESTMGPSATSINTVDVIVGPPPSGLQPVQTDISHISGHADADISRTIIDPFQVTGNTYQISFSTTDPTSPESTRVTITNSSTEKIEVDETPVPNENRPSQEVFPIIDGIQFYVQDTPRGIISITDQNGIDLNAVTNPNGNGRIVVTIDATLSPLSYYRGNDYEIRFLDSTQTSFAYNEDMTWAVNFGTRPYVYWTPVEVWDISDSNNPFQLHWMMDDKRPKNDTFESGDYIYIMESPFSIADSAGTDSTGMYPDPALPNTPGAWPENFSIALRVDGIVDTTGQDSWVLPNVDKIIIKSYHYLSPNDVYEVATTQQKIVESDVDPGKVKVVPNPYIVSAAWERDILTQKLLFTNLPPKCNIKIFTVSGEHLITLHHDNPAVGHMEWNFRTKEDTEVAYGLYIYKVESEWGDSIGKFAIIR